MENEKKSSRFGVRLSALMVAVLLVVCMTVPAFAATVEPDEYNKLPFALNVPDGYSYYILCLNASGTEYYAFAFNEIVPGYPMVKTVGNNYHFKCGTAFKFCSLSSSGSVLSDWVDTSDSAAFPVHFTPSNWFGNVTVYYANGSVFFQPDLPPPPDPLDSVGSGLTVVLDWVGATVSALFSGSLSGLLPLVAVPVAITLLLVAIIVIKRSIWGA